MKDDATAPMKLSQLRILVAVADYKTFSEAALQLDMSQSAVSHSISALEEALGVILLSRGRHGARLTPVGEQILAHARTMLQAADAITQEADQAKGLHGGQVRVASFRSIAVHVLPGAIATFKQQYPDIAVHLSEHDNFRQVEKALRQGRADIGFTILPAADDLAAWKVLENEYIALFPPHFELKSSALTWPDLAHYPLIMPPADRVMMQEVYEHVKAHGGKLNITSEIETDTTIVNLVAQGVGATILPRLAAEPIPAGIQVFSLPDPLLRIIGVAIVDDALQTPATYAFLDLLKRQGAEPSALADAPRANVIESGET